MGHKLEKKMALKGGDGIVEFFFFFKQSIAFCYFIPIGCSYNSTFTFNKKSQNTNFSNSL